MSDEKDIIVNEKQDSIEVGRNAKGEYNFKIKVYYNSEDTDWREINNRIQDIDKNLRERFLNG